MYTKDYDDSVAYFYDKTNISVKTMDPIEDGRVHSTQVITTPDGDKYVLKLPNKTYFTRFKNEFTLVNSVLPRIGDTSLYPDVIESNIDGKIGYILYEYVPSNKNINWVEKDVARTLITDIAKMLKALHTEIDVNEIEPIVPETEFYTESLEDHLNYLLDSTVSNLREHTHEEYIPEVEQAYNYLKQNLPDKKSFIHADVHLPNLLVAEDGTLNALVDWEYGRFGDIAYELAKVEVRVTDLYARFTPFSRAEFQQMFRDAYGMESEGLSQRIDAYKVIYTVRTADKMKWKSVGVPWKRQNAKIECWEAYDEILPEIIEAPPYNE